MIYGVLMQIGFVIIKFIDEIVLFNSDIYIRGYKLLLCVLEFGLIKFVIYYLGF